jgi:transposase
MKLYGGIDLHSTNNYLVLLDESGKTIYDERLPNDLEYILHKLKPYQNKIISMAVESTYNWYWLVDGLQSHGYSIRLANPAAIQQYNGIKQTGDKSDACFLADLLRLDILPQGYTYPKETRGIRDLLRKRSRLVHHKTAHLLSIQTTIERNTGIRVTSNRIKQLTEEDLIKYTKDKNILCALKSDLATMNCLSIQITQIEKEVIKQVRVKSEYERLLEVSGIGKILTLTIMLETGNIERFAQVGNYSSYCRCVNSKRISNGKKKGTNNSKNGNRYLSWAYIEAAHFAIRFSPIIKRYYQRKMQKTNAVIAIKAVAHKLARACYYVLRDDVPFDEAKCFGWNNVTTEGVG